MLSWACQFPFALLLASLVALSRPTAALCSHTIYILRHGQSDANAHGLIQGSSDFSRLTDVGKEQAAMVSRQALDGLPVDAVYVSPLSRAQDTLKEVQKRTQTIPKTTTTLHNLREIDFYDWQERHKDDLAVEFEDAWKAWKNSDPYKLIVPNGSQEHYPLLEMWERAGKVWQEIQQLEKERNDATDKHTTVLIVAHGSLGQALLGTAMGWDATHFRRHVFPNCGVLEIQWDQFLDAAPAERWRWKWPRNSEWSQGDTARTEL
ncbi:Probable 2-carboxy-D-arabinitol-1-phosphatase [Seminavis robusta]|uniref:Probable 2-carboxy-D-arabinitol-1-phosphatase n=1 Tax=Seminavis robusta TaxID=568900 RepID=A0A9N8HMA4_9STRA|nr:Probable 2-carboxy-D-arabinitol-1-phosphatase [Seminavis robusta]|eukprot:Sro982_g227680.1 Probable 2-carboxy-D-arabinitol-1-phosphatase (263) ;mRNA; f:20008-20796